MTQLGELLLEGVGQRVAHACWRLLRALQRVVAQAQEALWLGKRVGRGDGVDLGLGSRELCLPVG